MTKRLVNPTSLYDGSPFGLSHGTIDEPSGLLFVSGQVAWDLENSVTEDTVAGQLTRALENLQVVLSKAGAGINDLLQLRLYIRGELEDHMEELAPILSGFLGTTRVAMTGIGVSSLASKRTLVEVEAVARTQPL